MANGLRSSAERLVKVVLVGSSGAGKAAILRAVAAEYAHASVRAGELSEAKVFRTEFYWPESRREGGRLRVRLFGLSGRPAHNAVCELLVTGADGIVFVANLARDEESAVREAFQALLFNARHRRLDLTALPVALHYHQPTPGPAISPDELDGALGIPPAALKRFVTGRGDLDRMRAAVEWVIAELAKDRKSAGAPVRCRRWRRRAAVHA